MLSSLGIGQIEYPALGIGQHRLTTTSEFGCNHLGESGFPFNDHRSTRWHGIHASGAGMRVRQAEPIGQRNLPGGNVCISPGRPGTDERGTAVAIERIGIIGSGIMGSGIAEVAASTGHTVVLRSRSIESANAMLAGLGKSLGRQVEKGRREQADADAIIARVTATADLADLADCDLIIESVVEDLDVKLALFAELDGIAKADAIIATNTSTLPIVNMAMATNRPDKVCGVHFINPAPVMSLVEIIRPITASDETMAAVIAFAEACGKDPVESADRAGFIVNALLFPYLNNAVKMLDNGIGTRDGIDAAMKGGCNYPMGPFQVLDLVGLDTSVAILDALYDEFRDPNFSAAPRLRRMVTAGQLGRKSGIGFYDYRK